MCLLQSRNQKRRTDQDVESESERVRVGRQQMLPLIPSLPRKRGMSYADLVSSGQAHPQNKSCALQGSHRVATLAVGLGQVRPRLQNQEAHGAELPALDSD